METGWVKKIMKRYIKWRHDRIDGKNRKRLENKDVSLICSNCTGGFLYHWLGLRFNSPFINLYMDNEDFIIAMENFDQFMATELKEDTDSGQPYPIGIGYKGVKVHFMHYPTFEDAKKKWEERARRINRHNMAVWLTNFDISDPERCRRLADRFNKLDFKHKLIFSGIKIDNPDVVWLKGFDKADDAINIYRTQNLTGRRWIDQFDYVGYLNAMK